METSYPYGGGDDDDDETVPEFRRVINIEYVLNAANKIDDEQFQTEPDFTSQLTEYNKKAIVNRQFVDSVLNCVNSCARSCHSCVGTCSGCTNNCNALCGDNCSGSCSSACDRGCGGSCTGGCSGCSGPGL